MYQADEHRYQTMRYRRCGRSGIQLPPISLGLWHNFGGVDVFENGRAMLRRAGLDPTRLAPPDLPELPPHREGRGRD